MVTSFKINKSLLFDEYFLPAKQRQVSYLVLHHIAAKNIFEAIKELKKHQVSSHYLIAENGEIFQLVLEENIAYHAGVSFWNGIHNLNENSIGIEFLNSDPYQKGFNQEQIESGIKLCQNIINRYNLEPINIVGHSDIAYHRESGLLNRKDDPSFLFPWANFAKNNIGIWPKEKITKEVILENDSILFQIGDCNEEIKKIKEKLKDFGYKISNLNEDFDEEFQNLTIVFNRKFNPDKYLMDKDKWHLSSSKILELIEC